MLDEIAPAQQNYPDSYGGAYIDRDGRLHIQIVESAKDTADYVPDVAIVGYVKYSLNELRDTLDALFNTYQANQAFFDTQNVNGFYIREKQNCVFVELVKTEKSVDQAYELRISNAFGGSDLVKFTYTSAFCEESIAPGDFADGNVLNGTVGFPAESYVSSEKGFVTAAHLTSGVGAPVIVNSISGTVTQRQLGGSLDACFVAIPNATAHLTSSFNLDGNTGKLIAASYYDYPEDTVVQKAGNITHLKTGKIISTNYPSISSEGDPTLSPLYRIEFGPSGTAPGDSGAAVFVPLGGSIKILIGIHVRANTERTLSATCKYSYIRDAFSVNLYVD